VGSGNGRGTSRPEVEVGEGDDRKPAVTIT